MTIIDKSRIVEEGLVKDVFRNPIVIEMPEDQNIQKKMKDYLDGKKITYMKVCHMKKISLVIALVLLVVLTLVGCKNESSSLKKVVVACSPTPHAEIMNEIKEMMQDKGFELVIKEFNDYSPI